MGIGQGIDVTSPMPLLVTYNAARALCPGPWAKERVFRLLQNLTINFHPFFTPVLSSFCYLFDETHKQPETPHSLCPGSYAPNEMGLEKP